ncbi:sel1 repeat family protein [Massilia oculi]|uniref:Sel1 repeat family protein n=1 Tax=Massilia hydrophila TaxID=3044279 RepID=A0ABS7Y5B6_9BURK|nr:sel1 repeat family protein [Massilia oculi]MCA1854852.1 sel1 repeat family protein [Massilia oculi]
MKTKLFLASLLLCGAAHAGELDNANALFEKKDYAGALKIYTKLADAGNPEAQQALGQMYWYGEAGQVDEAKAEALFKKSAAKGNKVAAASLAVMEQRVKRRKDIDYWISGYDGEDLKSGEFRCATPRIPAMSKINADIDRIGAAITTWQDCYNRYVTNLNAATPLTKRVPEDIRKLMKKDELEKSTAYLEQLQANLQEEAKVSSKLVLADFEAWRKATDAYVSEHNKMVKSNSSTLLKGK